MDPRDTQSSFIPKQVLTVGGGSRRPPTVGLFTLISLLILLISVLFWGGSYAYAKFLQNEIERPCHESAITNTLDCGLNAKLERAKQELQQNIIDDLRIKEAKIRTAEGLIDNHLTALPVFDLIEAYTLKTISYDSLGYGDGEVTLSGEAKGYESIALQSDIFVKEVREFDSFLFSDLSPSETGRVRFKLTIKLRDGELSYKKYLGLWKFLPPFYF